MPSIKQTSPEDYLAAFLEDSGNAPLALYAGAALDEAGRHDEALIVWTFGDDTNPILRTVHAHPEAIERVYSTFDSWVGGRADKIGLSLVNQNAEEKTL